MTNTNTSDTSKSILTCSRVPHHLHAASVARHQGGLVPREGRIVEGVLASGVRPAVALVAVDWSCFCGWRWVEEVFGLCQGCFVGWGFKVGRKGETVRIGCIWSWATKFQKFLFTGYIKIPTKTSTGGSYPGETVEIIYIIAHKGGWMFFFCGCIQWHTPFTLQICLGIVQIVRLLHLFSGSIEHTIAYIVTLHSTRL